MTASKIEWTEHTWNPIVGCSIVSPGCTNCYAMRMAARIEATYGHGNAGHYLGTTKKVNGNAVWTGKLRQAPEKTFTSPLRRKTPTTYFVNSMGDLFHEDCPDEWIDLVFAVMASCPQHTFQVLTKRAERMRGYIYMTHAGQTLPNVWLGISCERQEEADERIPLLLQTPAAIRFISAEPLLGPIKLHETLVRGDDWLASGKSGEVRGLDWVIVGGESGPHARPMHPQWVRSIRDQCEAARVAFFFKQFGEFRPCADGEWHGLGPVGSPVQWAISPSGTEKAGGFLTTELSERRECEGWVGVTRAGKKAAGRLLDGVEHNGFPEARP
jgi:protein gp37